MRKPSVKQEKRRALDCLYSEAVKLRFLGSAISYWDDFGEDDWHYYAVYSFLHDCADRLEEIHLKAR